VRHSALHRIAVGLVAAFVMLGGAEHWFGFDPCPHHEGAFFVEAAESASGGHHAHHGGSADASESDSEGHGPCDCVGPCATPSPTALPATASFAAWGTLERVEVAAAPLPAVVPQQPVPYRLPYAHAPPFLG